MAPVYLDYVDRTDLSAEQLRPALGAERFSVPDPWQVTGGWQATMSVAFAAAGDPVAPPGVILGYSDQPRPAVVAEERLPILVVALQNGEARFDVQIVTTATALARTWAGFTIRGGVLRSTPLGRVGAGGGTVVIDADDRLILATYSDAWTGTGNPADDLEHFNAVMDATQQFLEDLLAASA